MKLGFTFKTNKTLFSSILFKDWKGKRTSYTVATAPQRTKLTLCVLFRLFNFADMTRSGRFRLFLFIWLAEHMWLTKIKNRIHLVKSNFIACLRNNNICTAVKERFILSFIFLQKQIGISWNSNRTVCLYLRWIFTRIYYSWN